MTPTWFEAVCLTWPFQPLLWVCDVFRHLRHWGGLCSCADLIGITLFWAILWKHICWLVGFRICHSSHFQTNSEVNWTCLLTGYLLKRSPKNGEWNKYWFVLNAKTNRVCLGNLLWALIVTLHRVNQFLRKTQKVIVWWVHTICGCSVKAFLFFYEIGTCMSGTQ